MCTLTPHLSLSMGKETRDRSIDRFNVYLKPDRRVPGCSLLCRHQAQATLEKEEYRRLRILEHFV